MEPSGIIKQAADEFRAEIRKTEVILVRWMFVFAVANVVVTAYLSWAFLK